MRLGRWRPPEDGDTAGFGDSLAELAGVAAEEGSVARASPAVEALVEAATARLPLAVGSETLAGAAAALEITTVHAVGVGYAIRAVECAANTARPLPEEIAEQLDRAPDRAAETVVVANALAGGGPAGAAPELGALTGTEPAVWDELERWVAAVGAATARRRLRAHLDAAEVGPDFNLDEAVERIDFARALRFGYVVAACEAALPLSGGAGGGAHRA